MVLPTFVSFGQNVTLFFGFERFFVVRVAKDPKSPFLMPRCESLYQENRINITAVTRRLCFWTRFETNTDRFLASDPLLVFEER